MFFKKNKLIKELEDKVSILEKKLNKKEMELTKLGERNSDLYLELEDIKLEIRDRERQEELEEYEASLEKCSCGGTILPMYEEYPNWIVFCNSCDLTSENFELSPIREPVN